MSSASYVFNYVFYKDTWGHLQPEETAQKNDLIGGGEAAGRSLADNGHRGGPFVKGSPTGIYGESNVKARTKW